VNISEKNFRKHVEGIPLPTGFGSFMYIHLYQFLQLILKYVPTAFDLLLAKLWDDLSPNLIKRSYLYSIENTVSSPYKFKTSIECPSHLWTYAYNINPLSHGNIALSKFWGSFNSAIHTAVCTIISQILLNCVLVKEQLTFHLVNIIIEIFWQHIYIIDTLPLRYPPVSRTPNIHKPLTICISPVSWLPQNSISRMS